jgi:hypothetical protein
MPLRINLDGSISGLRNDFASYERKIIQGKIPCPFTVQFRDSEISWVRSKARITACNALVKTGPIVASHPIPLTPEGKPKIQLFRSK